MSEYLFSAGDEEIHVTKDNTRVVHHHKGTTELNGIEMDNSRFDHLAIRMGQGALLLWREQLDGFNGLASELVSDSFESILNKRTVAKYALDAYQGYLDSMAERDLDGLDDGLDEILGIDRED